MCMSESCAILPTAVYFQAMVRALIAAVKCGCHILNMSYGGGFVLVVARGPVHILTIDCAAMIIRGGGCSE